MDNSAVFDESILSNLREIAGDAFKATYMQLKMLYLDSAPTTCDNLVEAANATDLELVKEASHALRSMSMNIGAVSLGKACQLVEDAAEADDTDMVHSRLYELVKEFHRVVKAIKTDAASDDQSYVQHNMAV